MGDTGWFLPKGAEENMKTKEEVFEEYGIKMDTKSIKETKEGWEFKSTMTINPSAPKSIFNQTKL